MKMMTSCACTFVYDSLFSYIDER